MPVHSACTLDCPDSCAVRLSRNAAGELQVRGDPDHPFTRGFTCARIRRYHRRLRSPERILHPLARRNGTLEPLPWPAALDRAAAAIQACRGRRGPFLHIQGGGDHGLLGRCLGPLFRTLGAVSTRGSLCDSAGLAASAADFGACRQNDPEQLLLSRTIVNWGRDPSRSSVHLAARLQEARKRGARLLTITPGGDGTARQSDCAIRLRPGTDRFLALAILRTLFEGGGIPDARWDRAAGAAAFQALLTRDSVDTLLDRCEASRADLDLLVQAYAADTPTATLIGWGLQRRGHGAETVRFLNALAFLSGHLERPGGGSTFGALSDRAFDLGWLEPAQPAPPSPFRLPCLADDLTAADPPVAVAWVTGSNIVNQAPDARRLATAFENLPFTIVADAFLTDTAARADLVLPCALMWEREDVALSYGHSYITHAAAAVEPPGAARTDLWMLREVGRRLTPPVALPDAKALLDRALRTSALGMGLAALRQAGSVRLDEPAQAWTGGPFAHPDGRFHLVDSLTPPQPQPADYPLNLLSLVRRDAIHSQILPADQTELPTVALSTQSPLWETLDLERPLFLVSAVGRMAVRLEPCPDLHPQAVIYRRGDWLRCGGGINQLIEARLTDRGEGAAYYDQPVRLENA